MPNMEFLINICVLVEFQCFGQDHFHTVCLSFLFLHLCAILFYLF